MRIRRKPPKVSRADRPLYVVGYSFDAPSLDELSTWFDLEYGGPLKRSSASSPGGAAAGLTSLTHGPWTAGLVLPLPEGEAAQWRDQLGWRHPFAALILPGGGPAGEVADRVLHAARLARGLTLLTEGTAYDPATGSYLNPADWGDRRLTAFLPAEHIVIEQGESAQPGWDWFHSRGLMKFGLDELETFRPSGLSAGPIIETLQAIAGEWIRQGRAPNVGAVTSLPALDLTVRVLRHRTAAPSGLSVALRELDWEPC